MKPYAQVLERTCGLSLIAGAPWTPEREEAARVSYGKPAPQPPAEFVSVHPPTGRELPRRFVAASRLAIDVGVKEAALAIPRGFSRLPGADRAGLLEAIAGILREHEGLVLAVAARETGLTRRRLAREFDRACRTLTLFADLVRDGSWVRAAVDTASPHPIGPNHDVRRMLVPLGVVAVFGASNFPLAYGAVGGDVASALAAGCPVVVKGHPLHPATGEFLASLVIAATERAFPRTRPPEKNRIPEHPFREGIYTYLHAGGERAHEVGGELVRHPLTKAVGFTGSRRGGEALIELATSGRGSVGPIPVFAEMGSVNPIVILPHAAARRAEGIADELARSILDSSGQQCTCPGVIFVPEGDAAKRFASRLKRQFERWRPRAMLGANLAENYGSGVERWRGVGGAEVWTPESRGSAAAKERSACWAGPAIATVALGDFEPARVFREEVFGPAVVLVTYPPKPAWCVRHGLLEDGSLAASLYGEPEDFEERVLSQFAQELNPFRGLVACAGRVVINGPPTGVRVAHGMVHGGPWPATNRPDTTAVGPHAMERWCRPVCFQNCPDELLPPELRDDNPLGVLRTVNGAPTREGVSRRA